MRHFSDFFVVKIFDSNLFINSSPFARPGGLIQENKSQRNCYKNVISPYHIKGCDRAKGNLIMLAHQKLPDASTFPKTEPNGILGVCLQKLTNVAGKIMY